MRDKRLANILNTLCELWKGSKEFGGKIPKHLYYHHKKASLTIRKRGEGSEQSNYPSYNLALTTQHPS